MEKISWTSESYGYAKRKPLEQEFWEGEDGNM
jgi:hypothetical protein